MPRNQDAYNEGREALIAGHGIGACPYMFAVDRMNWRMGYIRERNDAQDAVHGIKGEYTHV